MTSRLKPLSDQVVLITGASSGIGLLTARAAARRGAKVLLVARNETALAEAVDDIREDGGDADFAVADVADAEALAAAARRAVTAFGRIDTWISNAGVAIYAPLLDTPSDEHERLFATNYFGTVNSARLAVEHLAGGGALIVVASIASDLPSPVLGAYSASKHAVKAYVEALRIELAAAGSPIVVTLVKPAGMATPIGQHAANHLPGEALIPPPAYDPQVTVDALLFCAEHPRRELTVGGIGRAQVLFAEHFPALFESLATIVPKLLYDPARPKTSGDNLDKAGQGGIGEVPRETLLHHSLYNSALRHPVVAGAAVIAIASIALAAARRNA